MVSLWHVDSLRAGAFVEMAPNKKGRNTAGGVAAGGVGKKGPQAESAAKWDAYINKRKERKAAQKETKRAARAARDAAEIGTVSAKAYTDAAAAGASPGTWRSARLP